MERNLPGHIEVLVRELHHGSSLPALQSRVPYLSQEPCLLHAFTQLGFRLETNTFEVAPATHQAISVLNNSYSHPSTQVNVDHLLAHTPVKPIDSDWELRQEFTRTFYENGINEFASGIELGLELGEDDKTHDLWDFSTPQAKANLFSTPKPRRINMSASTRASQCITPSSVHSTPYADSDAEMETPRSSRGLKHLTSRVKHFLNKRMPTSYKDVAMSLIDDLIDTAGPERIKEEKNVRRRVYDAINVLIAAGVLEKDGKNVSWKEEWDSVEIEEKRAQLDEQRKIVEDKKKQLRDVLHKYLAIKHLVHRNSASQETTTAIHFPFIVVSTADSPSNSVIFMQMSITVNSNSTALHMKFAKPITLFGDMDVLLELNMHRIPLPKLTHYLPHRDLLKYCTPVGFSE